VAECGRWPDGMRRQPSRELVEPTYSTPPARGSGDDARGGGRLTPKLAPLPQSSRRPPRPDISGAPPSSLANPVRSAGPQWYPAGAGARVASAARRARSADPPRSSDRGSRGGPGRTRSREQLPDDGGGAAGPCKTIFDSERKASPMSLREPSTGRTPRGSDRRSPSEDPPQRRRARSASPRPQPLDTAVQEPGASRQSGSVRTQEQQCSQAAPSAVRSPRDFLSHTFMWSPKRRVHDAEQVLADGEGPEAAALRLELQDWYFSDSLGVLALMDVGVQDEHRPEQSVGKAVGASGHLPPRAESGSCANSLAAEKAAWRSWQSVAAKAPLRGLQ